MGKSPPRWHSVFVPKPPLRLYGFNQTIEIRMKNLKTLFLAELARSKSNAKP